MGSWMVAAFVLAFAHDAACGATFYVDRAQGSDANPGTSESLAWSSLKPLNEHTFLPGDRILLHAGQVWDGTLAPRGSGSADAPVVLSRYADGTKPLIRGGGAAQALLLSELSYWTVDDIAVSNHGPHTGIRNGIEIHVAYKGLSSGIHLVRVDVTDVNGEVGSKSSGGIGVMAWGKNGHGARFDDLLIDRCTVSHVDGQGIWFHVKGSRDDSDSASPSEDDNASTSYPNTRIRITGSTISDTGRNAIFLRDALNARIDHNVVHDAAARTHGNAVVVAGSKGTILAYNEVYATGAAGGGENGAFDADDGAVDTTFEYNWTHDNAGGSVNVVNDPTHPSVNSGTVVRYNVSENEGGHVFALGGNVRGTALYNNTVFVAPKHSPKILQAGRFVQHKPGDPDDILFADNVILAEDGGSYSIEATHVLIDDNCYSTKKAAPKYDRHAVIGDLGIDRTTLPARQWSELSRYRLGGHSACAEVAVTPLGGPGVDILGKKRAGVPGAAGAEK